LTWEKSIQKKIQEIFRRQISRILFFFVLLPVRLPVTITKQMRREKKCYQKLCKIVVKSGSLAIKHTQWREKI